MTVYVALLRGVNVGATTSLSMADLRAAAEGCGFEAVRTYIQSGNVLLRSPAAAGTVASRLRKAVEAATGLDTEIAVRSRAQLEKVVERNPFASAAEDDRHLHVAFLTGSVKASLRGFDAAPYAPEQVACAGREVYLHLPNGIGRSRLAAALARRTDTAGTVRNWRTVNRLLALAGEAS